MTNSIGQNQEGCSVLFEWRICLIRILEHASDMTHFSIHTCIDNNTKTTTVGHIWVLEGHIDTVTIPASAAKFYSQIFFQLEQTHLSGAYPDFKRISF